jgi:TP53 regulating kinase and related kinases
LPIATLYVEFAVMAPSSDSTTDPPPPTRPLHILPPPFRTSDLEVLTQGAEALVYKTTFLTPNTPCILKYRPPKPYRHPTLDKRLTKARLLAEARALVRVRRDGVKVPAVLGGDWESGWLVLEYIEGRTVRRVLDDWVEEVGRTKVEDAGVEAVKGGEDAILGLMGRIGKAVGRLHECGVCHGDLTTSNLMLKPTKPAHTTSTNSAADQPRPTGRPTVSAMREAATFEAEAPSQLPSPPETSLSLEGEVFLIDFGLAAQVIRQTAEEDRAVDLYVLERAFAATHPSAESLFQEVLRVYGESYKGAKTTLKRLADVRLRGRKRSMLG